MSKQYASDYYDSGKKKAASGDHKGAIKDQSKARALLADAGYVLAQEYS